MSHEGIARRLLEQGWCVTPDFFGDQQVREIRAQAKMEFEAGRFRPAAIGHGSGRQQNDRVRSDQILWLEQVGASAPVAILLETFDALRRVINASCLLGLFDFEVHLAHYAPGGGYARHVDRFEDDSARVLSCVLYLNDAWTPADGGQLRLFPPAGDVVEILPEAGTLVTFLSDGFPHEVLPARRERWSVTGWFRHRA